MLTKPVILLFAMFAWITVAKAQRLSFGELEEALNASLNQAQENLFLKGYSLIALDSLADKSGIIYTFSNRKKTLDAAKSISKAIYDKERNRSFVQYTTYETSEFHRFRRLMVEHGFLRSETDDVSENSNYRKDNLEVSFEIGDLDDDDKIYKITLRNTSPTSSEKGSLKNLNLKNIFKR